VELFCIEQEERMVEELSRPLFFERFKAQPDENGMVTIHVGRN
jgi:hypothetical protein